MIAHDSPYVPDFVTRLADSYAGHSIQRLMGFWALWHCYGGRDGLIESELLSKSGVMNQRAEFKRVFGCDLDEFMPVAGAAIAAEFRRTS